MTESVIAKKEPTILDLAPAVYYWCRCGRSNNRPFGDQVHKGSECFLWNLRLRKKSKYLCASAKERGKLPFVMVSIPGF